MGNRIKRLAVPLGVLGVLLGRILNRVLTSYFGSSATIIVLSILISIGLCIILTFIVMSQYFAAIAAFIMMLPVIIGGIGIYLDNIDIVIFSILFNFITCFILIKVMPKFKRDR